MSNSDRPSGDPEADPESVARTIALRRLTGSPQTRAQLAKAMAARHVPDEVAETVLDRFTEVGLVDDGAYARAWVESRYASRGLSRRALTQELSARGVAPDTAADAVAALDSDDEEQAARTLVARRLSATAGLPQRTRIRRLVAMLARKGYSSGLAITVVREALNGEDEPEQAVEDADLLDPP